MSSVGRRKAEIESDLDCVRLFKRRLEGGGVRGMIIGLHLVLVEQIAKSL